MHVPPVVEFLISLVCLLSVHIMLGVNCCHYVLLYLAWQNTLKGALATVPLPVLVYVAVIFYLNMEHCVDIFKLSIRPVVWVLIKFNR